MKKPSMIKKLDIVIIIAMVFVSFIPHIAFQKVRGGTYNKIVAVVTMEGEEQKVIDLTNHKGDEEFRFETDHGYNIVHVHDGMIRVIEADCKDQVDVRQGYISKPGETLVCLPHKFIVEIKGTSQGDDDDTILSY